MHNLFQFPFCNRTPKIILKKGAIFQKEILHQYDELTLPITKSFLGIKSAFIDTIFYSYCCTSIENFELFS